MIFRYSQSFIYHFTGLLRPTLQSLSWLVHLIGHCTSITEVKTKTEHTSFQSLNFSYTGTEDKNWNYSSHNFDCAFSVAPPEEIYIIRPLSALWSRGHNRKWGEGGKGTPKFQGREVLDSMRKIINCLYSLVVWWWKIYAILYNFIHYEIICFHSSMLQKLPSQAGRQISDNKLQLEWSYVNT